MNKAISLLVIFLFFASCTPLEKPETEATPAPQATETAKDAMKIRYYFNEPFLARGRDDATPCGLPETDFEAYVRERILVSWEVVEIRLVWGNKQTGPRCITAIIVYHREK